jgi:hypothetical protein
MKQRWCRFSPSFFCLLSSFLFLFCLALCCVDAAFAQAAHPRNEQPVPFAVGETLVYDVSWSSYVTAGEATLAVQERTASAGSPAYHIVADGRPSQIVASLFTLYYKVETWLDAFNLLPRRASTYTEEGRRKRTKIVTFDQAAHKATYEAGQPASRKSLVIPPLTQDPLSSLYVVRALRLASGQQLSMPVIIDGDLYRVALTTGGRETVQCGLGAVQAMQIDMTAADAEGQPVGRNLAVWLTTGRRQVPVQMKADLAIGSFRLVLREARGLLPAAPHGKM